MNQLIATTLLGRCPRAVRRVSLTQESRRLHTSVNPWIGDLVSLGWSLAALAERLGQFADFWATTAQSLFFPSPASSPGAPNGCLSQRLR